MNAFMRPVYEMGAGSSTAAAGGGSSGRRRSDYPGNRRSTPQQQREREEQRPAPPASRRVIRQLPTVVVTPEDLVDENNRECCICLEENRLKDRVIRLPCAHIYHPRCITDWLLKHCTCPVCRYELPTDDPTYEPLRIERMKRRKPRYARYELDRMSAKELRHLAVSRLNIPGADSVVEKSELIRCVVASGKIEVIAAPAPVEYGKSEELRAMGVGTLRKAMESAGVFFDPIDVVEKEDMVQIFVKSGRVVFREEEDDDDEVEKGADAAEYGYGLNSKSVSEEVENGDASDEASSSPAKATEGKYDENTCQTSDHVSNIVDMDISQAEESSSGQEGGDVVGPLLGEGDEDGTASGGLASLADQRQAGADRAAASSAQQPAAQQPVFGSRTVSELRALGRELGVDLSTCIEKREMVERLATRVSPSR